MDSRIDLTENRDFAKTHRRTIQDLAEIFRMGDARFPWDRSNIYKGDDNPYEPVATGDKQEREKKKNWIKMESGLVCERCGAEVRAPWLVRYGLCRGCDKEMEREDQKLWGNYVPRIQRLKVELLPEIDLTQLVDIVEEL